MNILKIVKLIETSLKTKYPLVKMAVKEDIEELENKITDIKNNISNYSKLLFSNLTTEVINDDGNNIVLNNKLLNSFKGLSEYNSNQMFTFIAKEDNSITPVTLTYKNLIPKVVKKVNSHGEYVDLEPYDIVKGNLYKVILKDDYFILDVPPDVIKEDIDKIIGNYEIKEVDIKFNGIIDKHGYELRIKNVNTNKVYLIGSPLNINKIKLLKGNSYKIIETSLPELHLVKGSNPFTVTDDLDEIVFSVDNPNESFKLATINYDIKTDVEDLIYLSRNNDTKIDLSTLYLFNKDSDYNKIDLTSAKDEILTIESDNYLNGLFISALNKRVSLTFFTKEFSTTWIKEHIRLVKIVDDICFLNAISSKYIFLVNLNNNNTSTDIEVIFYDNDNNIVARENISQVGYIISKKINIDNFDYIKLKYNNKFIRLEVIDNTLQTKSNI